MNIPNRIPLTQLGSTFDSVDAFVCCVSFEERCLSVAREIDLSSCGVALIGCFDQRLGATERHLSELRTRCGSSSKDMDLSTSDPLVSADALYSALHSMFSKAPRCVVIDVSTFTHEALMIMYCIVPMLRSNDTSVFYVYNGADNYSVGDQHGRKWLSRGTREVRSVVGYPGSLSPSRSTHLILLAGFEKERAVDLVREFEPSRLSLGCGDGNVVETGPHQASNEEAIHYIYQRSVSMVKCVDRFEFNPYSPLNTLEAVKKQWSIHTGMNTVISPMNTKLSTIGAAQFAIENSEVQLCYAQPLSYNHENYSTPKKDAWVLNVE